MKKYLMFALILCAIPAVAFGQNVTCEACTHVAPVYMGEGGFIATADGADMVTWVATCGGVTRTGEESAGDDGVVAKLLTGELACMAEDGGSVQVGPVMDGGWYWVTDDMHSAVGGLVSMEVLDNDMVDITSAGDGVSMTAGKGAVYLKEASSGRVGILPNILPEAPMPALRTCGFDDAGTGSATAVSNAEGARFTRRTTKCELGDGGTILYATSNASWTGTDQQIMDKAMILRPGGSATVTVTIDLWGNHSGFFTTDPAGHALLGQPAVAKTSRASRLTGVTYTASAGTGPEAEDFTTGTAVAGITMDTSTTTDVVTFSIASSSAHCSSRNNYPVPVSVSAVLAEASAAAVTPARSRSATGGVGSISFTVVCAAGSGSHVGQELVPENPFPADE